MNEGKVARKEPNHLIKVDFVRLTMWLKERKLSVHDVGRLCGMHYMTVVSLLNEGLEARSSTLRKISQGLGVPLYSFAAQGRVCYQLRVDEIRLRMAELDLRVYEAAALCNFGASAFDQILNQIKSEWVELKTIRKIQRGLDMPLAQLVDYSKGMRRIDTRRTCRLTNLRAAKPSPPPPPKKDFAFLPQGCIVY